MITPAESASKVTSFVTLFKGRGLRIAALLDYHKSQKNMVRKLEESNLLEDGHLLKTTDFINQEEADIEDLIGWKTICSSGKWCTFDPRCPQATIR